MYTQGSRPSCIQGHMSQHTAKAPALRQNPPATCQSVCEYCTKVGREADSPARSEVTRSQSNRIARCTQDATSATTVAAVNTWPSAARQQRRCQTARQNSKCVHNSAPASPLPPGSQTVWSPAFTSKQHPRIHRRHPPLHHPSPQSLL
jgi:hypothetical protein